MKSIMCYVKSFIDNTHVKIGIEKREVCIIKFKKDSFDIETERWGVNAYLKFDCKLPIFIDY